MVAHHTTTQKKAAPQCFLGHELWSTCPGGGPVPALRSHPTATPRTNSLEHNCRHSLDHFTLPRSGSTLIDEGDTFFQRHVQSGDEIHEACGPVFNCSTHAAPIDGRAVISEIFFSSELAILGDKNDVRDTQCLSGPQAVCAGSFASQ